MKHLYCTILAVLIVADLPALAQTDSSQSAPKFANVLFMEMMAAGYSAMAIPSFGDETIGVLSGVSGIGVLVMPFIVQKSVSDVKTYDLPFAIPYSIGMFSMSYYNFKHGSSHSGARKFLSNFALLNITIAVSALTAKIVSVRRDRKHSNVSLRMITGGVIFSIKL